MQKLPVNPWPWSLALGYHQGEIIQGITRQLVCAGQAAVDAEGNPRHPGDMRAQITLALDNLETLLTAAGMGFGNIIRLSIFSTDVDAALRNAHVIGTRLGAAGAMPPMTLLGVSRLALPALLVEIEATAAD